MIETSRIADLPAEALAMAGAGIHRSLGVGGHKAPGATRVVVAMSGGVDSSVTAALMKAAGYDVVGITLQLYDHGAAVGRKGACCAGQDIHDARRVADKLGMPHYVLDYESRFRAEVMDDFADTYLAGATPIPCVRCNQRVKFRDLLQTARDLGAEALATGHYARRVAGDAKGPHGGVEMHRGADPSRDQSYFLFATTRAQLDFLRFPLGDLAKTATRDIAARLELPVAAKPDSQDICFVPTGDYASVVAKLRPGAVEAGEILHQDGRVLGRHQGIINYTVGQRRGLGLVDPASPGEPLYVLRLDPENHRVIVGPKAALAVSSIQVTDVNWLGPDIAPGETLEVDVKVRSTTPAVKASLRYDSHRPLGERACPGLDPGGQGVRGGGTAVADNARSASKALINFETPQYGVSPGQAAVFYAGERLLGGGWIARPLA
jgi:tRNA-specific 2-thiouridylase